MNQWPFIFYQLLPTTSVGNDIGATNENSNFDPIKV